MIKLMIAEDERFERESLRLLIETYYAKNIEIVYETANGKDIVNQAIKNKPDIILMDIQMPEMDGLQAAEIIKKTHPNTEILILTAYSYFDYAKKALQIGVADYLVKPFSNDKFCFAIDRMLDIIDQKKKQITQQSKLHEKVQDLKMLLEKHDIDEDLPDHGSTDQIIELVKRYIETHLSEEVSLDKVAKHIGLSSFYLSKYFKKIEGVNFKDYLIALRMEKAKYLMIKQQKNVQETALRVGYVDPNYFSQAFKKYTGVSPTQYKEQKSGIK